MIFGLGIATLGITLYFAGSPPLWFLMTYIMVTFFFVGILYGNQNALAMQPLGKLAGIGAAVVGSLSTFISMPLGLIIGQSYNGTILPLVMGLVALSGGAIFIVLWVEKDTHRFSKQID